MSDESHLVFVYGTLGRGASNAFRMEGAEFVRELLVRGRLVLVDWYPGLILDTEANWVIGELWKVDSKLLTELDEFEGIEKDRDEGEEYRRVKMSLDEFGHDLKGLGESHAWCWEWRKGVDGFVEIPTGDWLNHVPMEGGSSAWTMGGCLVVPAIPIGGTILAYTVSKQFGFAPGTLWWQTGFAVLCFVGMVVGFACATRADRCAEKFLFIRFVLYVASFVLGLFALVGIVKLISVGFEIWSR